MATAMFIWVRRRPHVERSGRFCLSPGNEAGDGHNHGCLDALTYALGSVLEYAQCLFDALVGSSEALIFRQYYHDARPGVEISVLFEHLCHLFFGGVKVLPLREFDDRLHLFLRVGEIFSETTDDTDLHMEVLPLC